MYTSGTESETSDFVGMEELTERSMPQSRLEPAESASLVACDSRTLAKEEALLLKSMDYIGQWPSRAGKVDEVYAKSLRGGAEKLSRYVPSDFAPEFLREALDILKYWPKKGEDLLSEEQLEIRKVVTSLYDRWITARRLRFVEY